MVRFASIAFLVLTLPAAPASSEPPSVTDQLGAKEPGFHLPPAPNHQRFALETPFGRTEIAPNAQFGFGIFGLKPEKTHLHAVTVREINAPKQRRAAVGFSLKF